MSPCHSHPSAEHSGAIAEINPPSLHSFAVGDSQSTASSLQIAIPRGSVDDLTEPDQGAQDLGTAGSAEGQALLDAGRRRFTWASLVAIALMAVPFIWILWSLWGPANPLRNTAYEDNFYELQARAMFHGHLRLANGAIGIEGFVHDGRTYTYFGLFPSIIRMPIMLLTSVWDSKLTAPCTC